jgi:hypothetical protein
MAASYDIIYGGMKIPYLTNEYYYDDTVLYDIYTVYTVYFYIQYTGTVIINILLYYCMIIYSMIPPASKTKTKKISFNIQAWRSYRKVVLGS